MGIDDLNAYAGLSAWLKGADEVRMVVLLKVYNVRMKVGSEGKRIYRVLREGAVRDFESSLRKVSLECRISNCRVRLWNQSPSATTKARYA